MQDKYAREYWRANIRLLTILLSIWFFISYLCGIVFADWLDNFRIGGFKLGFWVAQQGSIYVFIALILVYVKAMDKLDNQYRRHHDSATRENIANSENPASAQSNSPTDGPTDTSEGREL